MRLVLGRGVVLVAALLGCRPPAPPSNGFTLLFFGRSPAASLGGLSWAPDPEQSRLVGFEIHIADDKIELLTSRYAHCLRWAQSCVHRPTLDTENLTQEFA